MMDAERTESVMSYSVLTTNALNMPPQLCAIAHDGRISAFSSIFPFPFFFLPLSLSQ